ncbi:hypothetical protein RJ142_CDS0063 [Klebsiella phage EKq1]|nr:hypothetical protein RJ142_CDS0063 [Klebsiella phage EKq1]
MGGNNKSATYKESLFYYSPIDWSKRVFFIYVINIYKPIVRSP